MELLLSPEPLREDFLKAKRFARSLGSNATLDSVATVTFDTTDQKNENPEIVFFENKTYQLLGEKKIALREPNTELLFAKQYLSQLIKENGKPNMIKYYFGNLHVGTSILSPNGFEIDFYAFVEGEVLRLSRAEFYEYGKIFKEFEAEFIQSDLNQQTGFIRNQVDKLFYELKRDIVELQTDIEVDKIQKDMCRLFPWSELTAIKQKLAQILFSHFNFVGFPESQDGKREPFFIKMNDKYYYYNGQDPNKIFFLGLDKQGTGYRAYINRDQNTPKIEDLQTSDYYSSELREEIVKNNLYL